MALPVGRIKVPKLSDRCTPVVLHITGKDNSVAGALSRFTKKVSGGDPYQSRELRSRFRAQVGARRGRVDTDIVCAATAVTRGNGWT